MNSSYVGITIDIIDYYPKDLDYSSYSFIFLSEINNFEREISFINANQICQKIPLTSKKEIKYSIKVLKDDSLIGLAEFIIPNNIIYRKEKIFDKICPINMTESTKKILFGNSNNSLALKIAIHSTLQYIDDNKKSNNIDNKKDNIQFFQKKKIDNKKGRLKIFTPTSSKPDNNYKNRFNIKANYTKDNKSMISNYHRKSDSYISQKNISTQNNRNHKRNYSSQTHDDEIPKIKNIRNKIETNKQNKNVNNEIKKENDKERDNNNNKNYNNIFELKKECDNYINENNEKISEIEDINEMINFTNNNIKKIIDYQLKNYDFIKEQISKYNNINEQFIKVNKKYKDNLSIKNKLIEKNQEYETQKEILLNKEISEDLLNNEFFDLKNNEMDIMKDIYSNLKINYDKNTTNKSDQLLLLIKVLKIISKRNGPLQNLLNQTNSIESQRTILKNILIKFKSELEMKE